MRRVVIESSLTELGKHLGLDSEIQKIDIFEVLNILKEDPREWALVCRVKMKDHRDDFRRSFRRSFSNIQRLEDSSDESAVFFLRHKPDRIAGNLLASGGFMSIPLEIRDGRIRASFVGSPPEIKRILKAIDKEGLTYRVVSNSDARFSPRSPLSNLTEKQRKVITTAFELGYYEIPKKISSTQLAQKLCIREATFARHRIKAERRILAELFSSA